MDLGNFSISLTVKDINVSKEFYEKLGFEVVGGDITQNYLIMKQNKTIIGLFQGMFDKNVLTFNPGWDENASNVDHFTDVRELQKTIQEKGIELIETVSSESGPGSFTLVDPDGNPILIDQHR